MTNPNVGEGDVVEDLTIEFSYTDSRFRSLCNDSEEVKIVKWEIMTKSILQFCICGDQTAIHK